VHVPFHAQADGKPENSMSNVAGISMEAPAQLPLLQCFLTRTSVQENKKI
jgi:hypothetical protein